MRPVRGTPCGTRSRTAPRIPLRQRGPGSDHAGGAALVALEHRRAVDRDGGLHPDLHAGLGADRERDVVVAGAPDDRGRQPDRARPHAPQRSRRHEVRRTVPGPSPGAVRGPAAPTSPRSSGPRGLRLVRHPDLDRRPRAVRARARICARDGGSARHRRSGDQRLGAGALSRFLGGSTSGSHGREPRAIKWLEAWGAPLLLVIGLALLAWSMTVPGGLGRALAFSEQFAPSVARRSRTGPATLARALRRGRAARRRGADRRGRDRGRGAGRARCRGLGCPTPPTRSRSLPPGPRYGGTAVRRRRGAGRGGRGRRPVARSRARTPGRRAARLLAPLPAGAHRDGRLLGDALAQHSRTSRATRGTRPTSSWGQVLGLPPDDGALRLHRDRGDLRGRAPVPGRPRRRGRAVGPGRATRRASTARSSSSCR